MLSPDELQLLQAIRDTGSLSRAAALLGKAPSTISHAARQLENRLDALLFDRRRYRLQLSPAGRVLVEESARIHEDVQRLTLRVKQVARGWEDRLWIVCDEIFEFETLLPVIRDFDALGSGVPLRIGHEVLGGTWEALREGRADLVIGATNEPPTIAGLRWAELGRMDWSFAVAPRHPLARAREPLKPEQVQKHRAVVVGDSSRQSGERSYGLQTGQPRLAVPTMRAKILAQREGLGVGWLPARRVQGLIERGELVEKRMAQPREPNVLYLGWRSRDGGEGQALRWWLDRLAEPRLAKRLIDGLPA
ncbi:LysR family transcriptional regulator [Pelomonas sp. SE-A7]|uniref:LysR family transcriptional regulator n=1 Tax=Pelomonas sp. SE-A7 TaxID=3054953 RepID=UPI00259C9CA7|nr:LysR family transcriptional regulator [Pelomonas sp. SE-A7]MDM4768203.1 LysR family transcriptional regulator [Pelomonas sp. SE-A7]